MVITTVVIQITILLAADLVVDQVLVIIIIIIIITTEDIFLVDLHLPQDHLMVAVVMIRMILLITATTSGGIRIKNYTVAWLN
jgi:hypothetical protein